MSLCIKLTQYCTILGADWISSCQYNHIIFGITSSSELLLFLYSTISVGKSLSTDWLIVEDENMFIKSKFSEKCKGWTIVFAGLGIVLKYIINKKHATKP